MRTLFRDYILTNGGTFHDLNEILAGRFSDRRQAERCARDLAELCATMRVELEVADEWLWLFLPVIAPAPPEPHSRRFRAAAAKPVHAKAPPLAAAPAEPFYRPRLQAERVFYLHDPVTGRIDWLFESREGMQGPFASKALAEKALADFVKTWGASRNEP